VPDRVKPSRMLLRLDAEIAAAATPVEADCKRAERAAYLSRLGRFAEARSVLDGLHQKHDRSPQVNVSAWSNLAEGLLDYFSNIGVSKGDRVQRAYALSVAAGLQPLRALCAAWLAQWDYTRLDMDGLAEHVAEAFRYASPQQHAARSRASLVAAQALHLGGRADLAQVWYRKSKDHATADSDDVTISALMHNMAWLRMLTLRQIVLAGYGDPEAGRHALLNAESTAHFDVMVGDSSWQELKPILRAQIVSLQGDAVQAVSLYEEHLAGAKAASRLQANLFADKAWCHAQCGQLMEASVCAELAITSLSDETQIDDRAATHSRVAQAFEILGAIDEGREHQLLAAKAWSSHRTLQARAVVLLAGIDEEGRSVD
jgi:hypothetical protein